MRVRWLVAVALLASLSACRDATSLELSGVAEPYAGPLASSAAKALECTGEVYESGHGNYDTGPEAIQDDADAALANWLGEESFGRVPNDRYVLEREEDGRVLFSYDVDGLTKVALIAHESMEGYDGTGWDRELCGLRPVGAAGGGQ